MCFFVRQPHDGRRPLPSFGMMKDSRRGVDLARMDEDWHIRAHVLEHGAEPRPVLATVSSRSARKCRALAPANARRGRRCPAKQRHRIARRRHAFSSPPPTHVRPKVVGDDGYVDIGPVPIRGCITFFRPLYFSVFGLKGSGPARLALHRLSDGNFAEIIRNRAGFCGLRWTSSRRLPNPCKGTPRNAADKRGPAPGLSGRCDKEGRNDDRPISGPVVRHGRVNQFGRHRPTTVEIPMDERDRTSWSPKPPPHLCLCPIHRRNDGTVPPVFFEELSGLSTIITLGPTKGWHALFAAVRSNIGEGTRRCNLE